jgi:hypothetical protein
LLTKQKRSKVTGTKCKQVQILYNKIISLFQGITDLLPLGKFPDTIILAVSYSKEQLVITIIKAPKRRGHFGRNSHLAVG